jgi:hypothetical protein
MALFAIAVPILTSQPEHAKAFIAELNGARKAEHAASRKRLGVRERTFHQQTPMGDPVIVALEGDDPVAAFARFGEADDSFTRWFKAVVKSIHGIDLDAPPPPGAMPDLVIDAAT